MKKLIILTLGILASAALLFYIFYYNNEGDANNQLILEKTLSISREYISARYRTDNVLLNAKDYKDYKTWNDEMADVINEWIRIEKDAESLQSLSKKVAKEKNDFNFITPAFAYDKQEISNIFDSAPAGKKIATLAKHLGVDAKRAYKLLQQDQAQMEADSWNEAGDTFQKLETSATIIKDGCKVAGFVGSVALTGGTSALATGSTLAKAAVIVSGADLTLEITDDAAKIALGNNNKISSITNDIRKVTEPISTIITISDIPNNLSKNIDRFNATIVALDQFRGAAQEGKIIGIELPSFTGGKTPKKIGVTTIKNEELEKWLNDNKIKVGLDNKETIEKILGIVSKQNEEAKNLPSGVDLNEEKTEVKKTTDDMDKSKGQDESGILSIVSPVENSFIPKQGLSFAVKVKDPSALMTDGKNVPVWCHWNFFINGKPYTEKINPSIIHTGTINVCEYSTTLIKEKGSLRVEFKLEKGTASSYSNEKNINVMGKTLREFVVK